MNKYKYLYKNIGLLTLSSFATKLLSFFLVPLYTDILTTTEYGTYDLFNTTVGVLLPILTLNVQDTELTKSQIYQFLACLYRHLRLAIISFFWRYFIGD